MLIRRQNQCVYPIIVWQSLNKDDFFLPFDCFPNRLLSAVAPRSPSWVPATDALGVPSCCSPTAVHIKGIKKSLHVKPSQATFVIGTEEDLIHGRNSTYFLCSMTYHQGILS